MGKWPATYKGRRKFIGPYKLAVPPPLFGGAVHDVVDLTVDSPADVAFVDLTADSPSRASKAECSHVTPDDDPPPQFSRRLPGTMPMEDLLLNLKQPQGGK